MAVISTFDQWQKDVFFSAAEEVQESADLMESVYRMWIREYNDNFEPQILDDLRRELQTTLGTAKWQLEEFERAVNQNYEKCLSNDSTIKRHNEFVVAIRSKIYLVEKAINESLCREGKQPLLRVQFNEEDMDEFENFLLSTSHKFQESKDKHVNRESVKKFKDTSSVNKDIKYVVEVEVDDSCKDQNGNGENEKTIYGSGAWKIKIDGEVESGKKMVELQSPAPSHSFRSLEFVSSKFKLFKNSFGKVKCEEDCIRSRRGIPDWLGLKNISLFTQGINRISERSRMHFTNYKESSKDSSLQKIRRFGGLHGDFIVSQSSKRSLQVTLLLLVTIFLLVPFILYSA